MEEDASFLGFYSLIKGNVAVGFQILIKTKSSIKNRKINLLSVII